MHFLSFLAAFLLVRRIQKYLQPSPLYQKWNRLLKTAEASIIVLFVLLAVFSTEKINCFAGSFMLLGIILFADKQYDFRHYKPLLHAHYPLVGSVFLNGLVWLVFPGFYDEWEIYFQFAVLLAFAWIYVRWASSKKQQELKIVASRKDELEVMVAERTAEINRQKDELQEAVKELQATQAQLIQQEKLASLGELTAGIAHEIQNPLNFVNNFSEVSTELLEELKTGPLEQLPESEKEYAEEIIRDLTQNLEKITFHGKRADSIVKGMLQHSRASTGQKELTDINALADEYLRLSYHGCRARDKSFNATMETHFAPFSPQLKVVPQDMGRVLLNLFNNAFYSVSEKKKQSDGNYQPTVEVRTTLINGFMEIKVKDNGIGIPEHIKDKIMQPFFTTKPAGEGTGLGLSLSYDIVVKGHDGKIDIESEEGEYTEFTVSIPV